MLTNSEYEERRRQASRADEEYVDRRITDHNRVHRYVSRGNYVCMLWVGWVGGWVLGILTWGTFVC